MRLQQVFCGCCDNFEWCEVFQLLVFRRCGIISQKKGITMLRWEILKDSEGQPRRLLTCNECTTDRYLLYYIWWQYDEFSRFGKSWSTPHQRTISKGNLNGVLAINGRGVLSCLCNKCRQRVQLSDRCLFGLPPSLQVLALFKQEGYFVDFWEWI